MKLRLTYILLAPGSLTQEASGKTGPRYPPALTVPAQEAGDPHEDRTPPSNQTHAREGDSTPNTTRVSPSPDPLTQGAAAALRPKWDHPDPAPQATPPGSQGRAGSGEVGWVPTAGGSPGPAASSALGTARGRDLPLSLIWPQGEGKTECHQKPLAQPPLLKARATETRRRGALTEATRQVTVPLAPRTCP